MNRMKKLYIIIITVVVLIVLIITSFFYFSETNIHRMIEKANYCRVDNDCIIINFDCPFSCGSYISKNKETRLKFITSIYHRLNTEECIYDCIRPVEPSCENSRCVERTCEIGVYIDQFECLCPDDAILTIINNSGMMCSKIPGEEDLNIEMDPFLREHLNYG